MNDRHQNPQIQEPSTALPWPTKILGPAPGLKELNLIFWGLLAGLVVAPLIIRFGIQIKSGAGISKMLPLDFIYFYGTCRIVNSYPLVRPNDPSGGNHRCRFLGPMAEGRGLQLF